MSGFAVVGDVFVGNPDSPSVRLEEAHDLVQRDRFAHAASSQDANRLAGHDVEADAIEHHIAAKCLVHILKLDVGLCFVHLGSMLLVLDYGVMG